MRQVNAATLQSWLQQETPPALVDVREEYEHAAFNIGGELLPMSSFAAHIDRIPKDRPVVVYCEKGIRSVILIQRLEAMGFDNLVNLEGGMKAWRAIFPQGE